MNAIKYADAGMDMKKLALCFAGKIWLALAAAAAGALLGGGLYTAAHTVPESGREYKAVAKIYLDFAVDETGEVYQKYNGYTWNDLMATDLIMDRTLSHLPEDYTREEVAEATTAEILSDLRLLTVTITTHDRERCDAVFAATKQALVEYGEHAKEFTRIQVIQSDEAQLVTADVRTGRAVCVGAVIALLCTLLVMLLFYVLDDRIMVAGDLRQVTDAPFVGYPGAGERLNRDYEEALAYIGNRQGRIAALPVEQGTVLSEQKWRELQEADGIVIVAEYRKVHAAFLAYVIEQMHTRDCRIAGVAIGNADEKFMRRYYGKAVGRAE